jgi:hypothetical protein
MWRAVPRGSFATPFANRPAQERRFLGTTSLLPSRTNCQLTNPPSLFTVGLEGERVADVLYIWLFGMLGVNAFVIILALAHAMQQPDP